MIKRLPSFMYIFTISGILHTVEVTVQICALNLYIT